MEVPLERFKVDTRHKWLYSVVPSFPLPGGINPPYDTVGGGIYLAGFCPVCRNAFTVRLQEDGTPGYVLIRKLDVPVEGCQPV